MELLEALGPYIDRAGDIVAIAFAVIAVLGLFGGGSHTSRGPIPAGDLDERPGINDWVIDEPEE